MTLRELAWMAEGKRREAWDHTAVLRADVNNQWREKPISPLKFHPFREYKKPPPPKPNPCGVEMLAAALCDGPGRGKPE